MAVWALNTCFLMVRLPLAWLSAKTKPVVGLVIYSQNRLLVTKTKATSEASDWKLTNFWVQKDHFKQRFGYLFLFCVWLIWCILINYRSSLFLIIIFFILIVAPLCPFIHPLIEEKWPWARMPSSKHLRKLVLGFSQEPYFNLQTTL